MSGEIKIAGNVARFSPTLTSLSLLLVSLSNRDILIIISRISARRARSKRHARRLHWSHRLHNRVSLILGRDRHWLALAPVRGLPVCALALGAAIVHHVHTTPGALLNVPSADSTVAHATHARGSMTCLLVRARNRFHHWQLKTKSRLHVEIVLVLALEITGYQCFGGGRMLLNTLRFSSSAFSSIALHSCLCTAFQCAR